VRACSVFAIHPGVICLMSAVPTTALRARIWGPSRRRRGKRVFVLDVPIAIASRRPTCVSHVLYSARDKRNRTLTLQACHLGAGPVVGRTTAAGWAADRSSGRTERPLRCRRRSAGAPATQQSRSLSGQSAGIRCCGDKNPPTPSARATWSRKLVWRHDGPVQRRWCSDTRNRRKRLASASGRSAARQDWMGRAASRRLIEKTGSQHRLTWRSLGGVQTRAAIAVRASARAI
jgi:hypothetical protein